MSSEPTRLIVTLVTGERITTECSAKLAEDFRAAASMRTKGGLVIPSTKILVRVEHVVKVEVTP